MSRDDPISNRQGDSGVPCSFIYIDVNLCERDVCVMFPIFLPVSITLIYTFYFMDNILLYLSIFGIL